jgi:hypothetical protein
MKTEPTDHGLLMSGPMALAAYRGLKTQTRRPMKPQPKWIRVPAYEGLPEGGFWDWDGIEMHHPPSEVLKRCPFGLVGDRVYVRETYQTLGHGSQFGVEISYAADGPDPMANRIADKNVELGECPDHDDRWRPLNWGKWRPSIHMPKWASRTWGTIKSVRVQRLRDITWCDIRSEGVRCPAHDFPGGFCRSECQALRGAFACLWDDCYMKPGLRWFDNPWVWAVTWRKDG